ncbi:MAG: rhomboid family intramembrane serine protease [Sedimentisphaerales bacterium]
MLLPIRINIEPRRTPYTNYALIAANVVIFAITYNFTGGRSELRPWAESLMLTPAYPSLWQFITYAFLHGGFLHIFGNMYFLYMFGNNVNDRLGHVGYLCFYLAGAVFSAIGHILIAPLHGAGIATPVLGASGAIAAVTGAYLVLYPQTLITIIYWFFIIGTMEVPAIYLILLKMIFIDNIISRSAHNVAYDAHLAGYTFGIGSILLLLATKLLPQDDFDLWATIRRWNARRVYRDAVAESGDPFAGRISKKIKAKEVKTESQKQAEDKATTLRQEILTRISEGNLASAAELYLELTQDDAGQPLPRQPILDIANQLMSIGNWASAAEAYERFLVYYSTTEHSDQVQLMLGIIYARYLPDKTKALEHLKKAYDKLNDPAQKKLCADEINRLND